MPRRFPAPWTAEQIPGQTVDDRMKALYVDGAAMLPKPYTDHALKDALQEVLGAV